MDPMTTPTGPSSGALHPRSSQHQADRSTSNAQQGDTPAHATVLSNDQVVRLRERLLRWGRANFQVYPWRAESDPWLSLVAEFLLQRTRASQVQSVYLELRQKFPTAESLAASGTQGVRALTDRLGLHWRGPLLVEVAKRVALRGGRPPETLEELRKLPGVGGYTAGAWLSLHRGRRMPIIDANVCRWLSRVTGLPYNRDPRHVRWVKDLAGRLTPRRAFRAYNYAILDFTMTICIPRNPQCPVCPLRPDCLYGLRVAPIQTIGRPR